MRIAIGGFALESASFLPKETHIADFEKNARRGADLVSSMRGTASVAGGFIDSLESDDVEILPLVYTDCSAAGNASDDAFDAYCGELCGGMAGAASRVDGALIFLHGAMTTPNRTDPELDLMRAIRNAAGPDLPIMLALDLHANLSPEIVETCSALFGYHYSPHVDMAQTGARAARCMVRMLRGEIEPVTRLVKVPVVLPSIFTATAIEPLSHIVDAGFDWERKEEGVIDVSVFCGFAYADVPQIGFSVAVVTDGDEELAGRVSDDLCARIWDQRHELLHRDLVYSVEAGIARAGELNAKSKKPVVLLEHADRMNDSTWVLRALVKAKNPGRVAVPYLWDPTAAAEAMAAGEGATVTLDVGGHSSDRAGGPVSLTGKVIYCGEKSYVGTGPMRGGQVIELGPTAVIDAGGIVVWVTERSLSAIDDDPFKQFGFDPAEFDIIVLRSKTHFRAIYEKLAAEIIIVDTPDWGPAELTTLPFKNARDGVFPISAL
ncbi:MAG: M81 family metallopeptidase [Rhodospirillales bacterium]|jgi:microcystin degradation protein MlrC|nr:M81 family metallopeptidase [Rhodospirillales bacterium]